MSIVFVLICSVLLWLQKYAQIAAWQNLKKCFTTCYSDDLILTPVGTSNFTASPLFTNSAAF